jgi:hypothetical protein
MHATRCTFCKESVLAVGVPRGAARHPRGEVMLGWWSRVRVYTQKAKSRFLRRENWSRPGAVGMVRQGTCMPHVVHHVKQACWLLECSGGLRDSPGERPSLGDVPVVMCVLKAKGRCKQACVGCWNAQGGCATVQVRDQACVMFPWSCVC